MIGDTTPISAASAVAPVSKADAAAKKQALEFESILLQQLTQSLSQTAQNDQSSQDDGSGDDTGSIDMSDSSTNVMQQMLPDTLAQALTASGGIGLAASLLPKSGATR